MSNRNKAFVDKQTRILKAVLKNLMSVDGMFQELEEHNYAIEKVLAAVVATEMFAKEVDLVENEYGNAFLEGDRYMEYRHKKLDK